MLGEIRNSDGKNCSRKENYSANGIARWDDDDGAPVQALSNLKDEKNRHDESARDDSADRRGGRPGSSGRASQAGAIAAKAGSGASNMTIRAAEPTARVRHPFTLGDSERKHPAGACRDRTWNFEPNDRSIR